MGESSNPRITDLRDGSSATRLILRITQPNSLGEQESGPTTSQVVAEGIEGNPNGRSLGSPGDLRIRKDVPEVWQKRTGIRTKTGWVLLGAVGPTGPAGPAGPTGPAVFGSVMPTLATGIAAAADNHARIQVALDYLRVLGGGELVIPTGIYQVDTDNLGPLLFSNYTSIRGLSAVGSRIVGNGACAVFAPANGVAYDEQLTGRTLGVAFRDVAVWNTAAATVGGICIDLRQCSNGYVHGVDVRFSERGIQLGGAGYSNVLSAIQASGCDIGYAVENGGNANNFSGCRASGVEVGFLVQDGLNFGVNDLAFWGCRVETFSTAAIQVRHTGVGVGDHVDLRFRDCRFSSGPVGFDLIESGARVIQNLRIDGTHNDGVAQILEWTIGGTAYSAGPNSTTTSILGSRAAMVIHQGKAWPLRLATRDAFATGSPLLMYTTNANQVGIRGAGDTVAGDLLANDITSTSNLGAGARTERITANRLRVSGGTAHVAGNYALSPGWGNAASIAIASGSLDGHGRVSVTANGAGIGSNPTVVLTFADGAWPTAPFLVATRGDSFVTAGEWRRTDSTASTQTWTFLGTPVAGEIYVLDFVGVG